MTWYEHPIINRSELARMMKISPSLLHIKINKINRNRITPKDSEKLAEIKRNMFK